MFVLPIIFDGFMCGSIMYPYFLEGRQLLSSQKDGKGLMFEPLVGRGGSVSLLPEGFGSFVHGNVLFGPPVQCFCMSCEFRVLMALYPTEGDFAWKGR